MKQVLFVYMVAILFGAVSLDGQPQSQLEVNLGPFYVDLYDGLRHNEKDLDNNPPIIPLACRRHPVGNA